MKTGDKVKTPDGEGVVVDTEEFYNIKRYGIRLENNPFTFPVAYYFRKEINRHNVNHTKDK